MAHSCSELPTPRFLASDGDARAGAANRPAAFLLQVQGRCSEEPLCTIVLPVEEASSSVRPRSTRPSTKQITKQLAATIWEPVVALRR
jgi:hypothetical protein